MRAVVCHQFGPPEDLVIEGAAEPTPGPGEVLIDVKAIPVTFPDCLMLEDKYQYKAPLPYVPGSEVAGIVTKLGPGVTDLAVGARVVGRVGNTGAYAERALAPAADTRSLPDHVEFAESTGLMYAHGTSYYGLKHRGALQAGETLLVLGAGGNVGSSAVDLGKLLGARVIAAASSEEKLALSRDRGADETINYTTENLKERAKALTDGRGCDVVYDVVGGEHAEAALRATAWGGRFLVIGFAAGIPRIPLNLALLKSCQIVGVFLGAMLAREPELGEEIMTELLEMTGSGKLKPHVAKRYPLEEAPRALRDLMDRKSIGKIVLEP